MPNCNTMSCFLKTALMILAFVFCLTTPAIFAQTNAFSYQGRFTDNGSPASGRYDMQFRLFDSLEGGAQQGPTITFNVVEVDNGVFAVTLNFGLGIFPGADRFLEIGIRPSGSSDPYTTLSPRQPIASAPYAVRSLEANRANGLLPSGVGCVTAAHIGGLPAGSPNYIKNSSTQQAASNFNISGNGTIGGTLSVNTLSADTLNAAMQYNIGGNRVLSVAGTNNTFAGVGAGTTNTGSSNSFFGSLAGNANTTGGSNSFFGRSAGEANTTGDRNVFFGNGAGDVNTTASNNVFIGFNAGALSNGSENTFVGFGAGAANTTGFQNIAIGVNAGDANTTGFLNTLIGHGANVGSGNLTNASAIGAGATVFISNTIVLGRMADSVRVPGNIEGGLNVIGDLQAGSMFTISLQVDALVEAGSGHVCHVTGDIVPCLSTRRVKDQIRSFHTGLSLVQRLRPVTFNWKRDGEPDIGLIAEEVAEVEPRLATYNSKTGLATGVKYDQLNVVFVNAVREQQQIINSQQRQLANQKSEIDALKRLVCATHPRTSLCKAARRK